ncbi:MAG: magnesium transporter [Candidatus Omnitrophica bacterium]|nr:magnesium transporter [Candidatus Omnitrophota bacterium]
MSTRTSLLSIIRKYFEDDPLKAAHSLETMTEAEAVSVLKSLPPNLSALAVPHLQVGYAAALLNEIPVSVCKEIVEKLDSQQAASIFMNLRAETRQKLMENLPDKIKRQIQEFLIYPEASAGRMMATDFLSLHTDIKVKDAIQKIRSAARKGSPASYAYVVNPENRLVGVLNMRDLVVAPSDDVLETVMRKDIFSVNAFTDREEVAQALSKRRYFAAPVVDSENRLLGVVKIEQLLEDAQEEATEDIQKMFGAGGDERVFSPIGFSLKMRLPWLYINLGTAFLAGFVVSLFEGLIAKITVLAVYLPIIAGQGGNAGAQSLAVVMRGLVLREISPNKAFQLTLKELGIGIVNGIAIGVVTAIIALVWHKSLMLGVVVGLAMILNLAVAGLTGAAIPLTMKAVGLDPAQCSNIILTTFTDVMGFFSLLGLAFVFQGFLI